MQSGNAKEISSSVDSELNKLYQRSSSSIKQQQSSFSLELWRNAFRDACERICPVRAGGHDCGCLPVLLKVVNFSVFFFHGSNLMVLLNLNSTTVHFSLC